MANTLLRMNSWRVYKLHRVLPKRVLSTRSWSQNQKRESQTAGLAFSVALSGIIGLVWYPRSEEINSITNCEAPRRHESDKNIDMKTTSREREQHLYRQKQDPPLCGEWCASVASDTPCMMDKKVIPCEGSHCATTSGLWSLFAMGPYSKKRPVSCDMYKEGLAYPIGAVPCDPDCLIDEISKDRYPKPTGLGVFCRPGTCKPAACAYPKPGSGLGSLQCPCNWFGSECEDDFITIRRVAKERIGNLDLVTLKLDHQDWQIAVKDYRPGSVVRLHYKEKNDSEDYEVHEMACAIAKCDTPGEIEIIVAPTNPSLKWEVRRVGEFIRSLPEGEVNVSPKIPLFVNPAISGFYNARYQYLADFIEEYSDKEHELKPANTSSGVDQNQRSQKSEYNQKEQNKKRLEKIIIVSTGASLGAAIATIDSMLKKNKSNDSDNTNNESSLSVDLYYGLRDVNKLPYREYLEELVKRGIIQLILIESGSGGKDKGNVLATQPKGDTNSPREVSTDIIKEAYIKGEKIKAEILAKNKISEEAASEHRKIYVQDALDHYLADSASDAIETAAFVVCGRIELINGVTALLRQRVEKCGSNESGGRNIWNSDDSSSWMQQRIFLNI